MLPALGTGWSFSCTSCQLDVSCPWHGVVFFPRLTPIASFRRLALGGLFPALCCASISACSVAVIAPVMVGQVCNFLVLILEHSSDISLKCLLPKGYCIVYNGVAFHLVKIFVWKFRKLSVSNGKAFFQFVSNS